MQGQDVIEEVEYLDLCPHSYVALCPLILILQVIVPLHQMQSLHDRQEICEWETHNQYDLGKVVQVISLKNHIHDQCHHHHKMTPLLVQEVVQFSLLEFFFIARSSFLLLSVDPKLLHKEEHYMHYQMTLSHFYSLYRFQKSHLSYI